MKGFMEFWSTTAGWRVRSFAGAAGFHFQVDGGTQIAFFFAAVGMDRNTISANEPATSSIWIQCPFDPVQSLFIGLKF